MRAPARRCHSATSPAFSVSPLRRAEFLERSPAQLRSEPRRSERGSIPGTIARPTVSRPVWPVQDVVAGSGWASAFDAFFEGSASFSTGSISSGTAAVTSVAGDSIGTILLAGGTCRVFCLSLHALGSSGARGGRSVKPPREAGNAASARRPSRGDSAGGRRSLGRGAAAAGGGRPGRGDRLFVRAPAAHPRSTGVDPARARPDGPALRPGAARSRARRLAGRDPPPVRGCLLRAEAAHRPGVRVGLESRQCVPGTPADAGCGSVAMRSGSTLRLVVAGWCDA